MQYAFKNVLSVAATLGVGAGAGNIFMSPASERKSQEAYGLVIANIAETRKIEAFISQSMDEAAQFQAEAENILQQIAQNNDQSETTLAELESRAAYANMLLMRAQWRRAETKAIQTCIQRFNEIDYVCTLEEAQFHVRKAQMQTLIQDLDASVLPRERRQALNAYKDGMSRRLASLSYAPQRSNIMPFDLPSCAMICDSLQARDPRSAIAKAVCEAVAEQICEEIAEEVGEFVISKFEEKFKNLSLREAIGCVTEGVKNAVGENTIGWLNPGVFNPANGIPQIPNELEDLFSNPNQHYTGFKSFSGALDQCIEQRNKEILEERERQAELERQLQNSMENNSCTDMRGDRLGDYIYGNHESSSTETEQPSASEAPEVSVPEVPEASAPEAPEPESQPESPASPDKENEGSSENEGGSQNEGGQETGGGTMGPITMIILDQQRSRSLA